LKIILKSLSVADDKDGCCTEPVLLLESERDGNEDIGILERAIAGRSAVYSGTPQGRTVRPAADRDVRAAAIRSPYLALAGGSRVHLCLYGRLPYTQGFRSGRGGYHRPIHTKQVRDCLGATDGPLNDATVSQIRPPAGRRIEELGGISLGRRFFILGP